MAEPTPETREQLVSVVIPTRDRAALVGRAIASVVAQTRPADEIVVVDDGSTDATADVVAGFPGVRYAPIAASGVSAARNHGLRVAGGAWLAFLDSDDEWQPRKLEVQLRALAEAPEHLVCHTDEIWIREGRRVNPRRRHRKHGGWIFRHCLPLCAISPSAVVIHRAVFDRVGTFDESFPACEDYDLWLRICAIYPVLYVDEKLVVKHGGHEDQLSRTVEALDKYRIRALRKVLAGGTLTPDDRRAAQQTLREKRAIYLRGALRRRLNRGAAREPGTDSRRRR